MNPIVQSALGSIIRGLLWAGAGYLVKHGLWTDTSATVYVEAGTLAALGFLWSVYQAWKNDQLVKYLSERLHWHQWSAVRTVPTPPEKP